MKKMIIGIAAAGVVLTLMASAQPQSVDERVASLAQQVAELGLRVDRLEHASGGSHTPSGSSASSGRAASSGSAASPSRTMTLVSVSQSDHSQDNAAQIAQLKRQAASLMNTVNQAADQEASDAGQQAYVAGAGGRERGWGEAAGSGYVTTNVGSMGRQVLADNAIKNRYSTLAYIKREKLQKLHNANARPKQLLNGHNEHTVYVLETTVDLTESLDKIAMGDTVTWTGKRLSAEEGSETWEIRTIEKVSK